MKIRNASIADYQYIYDIAIPVWEATYSSLLTQDQMDYMLGLFYSREAIADQITNGGHRFLLAEDEGVYLGFASYQINYQTGITKLHKLYVLPQSHGKGIGKALVNLIEAAATENSNDQLLLNVNRFNPAINFYLRAGFENRGEDDVDIGNGYLMEDYLMVKKL
jgi:GNAT superfamily N-acetyltransferase